jgi:hypothetical protein
MCDTFRPLFPTKAALELDDMNYPLSWENSPDPKPDGKGSTGEKSGGSNVNTWS